MNLAELSLRFIAGGSLIVAVSLIAHSGHARIAGVVMLFPAVTLVSLIFLDPLTQENVKQLSLGGLVAIPCTLGFLLAVFLLADRVGVGMSIALGVVCWLVIAILVVFLQMRYV